MPRLGIGMPLVSTTTEASVLAVQDFFWLNDISGELTPIHTASRTNLVLNSASGSYGNGPGSEISALAPDGSEGAIIPVPNSDSDRYNHTIAGGTYPSGTMLTYSWYRKRLSTPALNATFVGDLYVYALVNCTQIGGTTEIESGVSGYDRFSVTVKITSGSSSTILRLYFGSVVGIGNQSVAYWGHQLEQDSRASAYIPTSGSAVTVTTTLNDTHNAWDYDSANLTLEEDPDSEGSWQRPSNVVLNHNFADLGDSVLTGNNSNFDTGIGSWVGYNGGTLAHSTDKLRVTLTTGESGARINTNGLISGGQAGKTFKVRARVWQGTTTSTTLKIYIGGNQENINISSTPTYFEVELTAPNSGDLFIYKSGSGDTGTYFIDDVTVKEIDPNDRWSTAGGWSIEGGKAVADGSQSTTNILYQDCGLVAGNTYTVSFSSNRVSGVMFIRDADDATLYTLNSGDGLDTQTFNVNWTSSSGTLKFYAYSYEGSIDNITVKEYAAMPLDV
tara:strand:+ start:413 stop:1918 length:1506 start_codon:yes stop_codon:yes gene_type:complete